MGHKRTIVVIFHPEKVRLEKLWQSKYPIPSPIWSARFVRTSPEGPPQVRTPVALCVGPGPTAAGGAPRVFPVRGRLRPAPRRRAGGRGGGHAAGPKPTTFGGELPCYRPFPYRPPAPTGPGGDRTEHSLRTFTFGEVCPAPSPEGRTQHLTHIWGCLAMGGDWLLEVTNLLTDCLGGKNSEFTCLSVCFI